MLDEGTKTDIYKKHLPMGIPRSIKSINYEADKPHQPPLVQKKDAPLKIYAPPIKKTGTTLISPL